MADPPKIADDFQPYAPSGMADDFETIDRPGQGGVLGNKPDDSWIAGTAKNLGTSVLKGATHLPGLGLAGDVVDMLDLGQAGVRSIWDKRSWREILKGIKENAEAKRQAGEWQPMSGGEIYDRYVKPVVGEYEPTTTAGKVGRAFTEAALPSGAMAGTATRAVPRIGLEAPTLTEKGLGLAAAARPAIVGGIGGVSGEAAAHHTDNPFVIAGASMLGPVAAETGISARRKFLPPITKEEARQRASAQIAKDIKVGAPAGTAGTAVREAYDNALKTYEDMPDWQRSEPGATPRIAEASGNRELASGELVTTMANEGARQQIMGQDAARGAAREKALRSTVDPAATGLEPQAKFGQYLRDLEDQVDQALPSGVHPDEVGAGVRKPLQEGRKTAEQARTALYDLLEEQFGDQTLLIPGLKKKASDVTKHKPGYETKKPDDAFTTLAKEMPDEVKFSDLRSYMTDVNEALAAAKSDPKATRELGRLKALKGAIWGDLENAVTNRSKAEAEAVAKGQMDPNGTLQSALERQRDEWQAARQASEGQGVATGAGADGPGGTGGISPAPGAQGAGAGPGGGAPGGGAVPGTEQMGPAAVAALKAANDAQKYLGETYRQGSVGKLLQAGKNGEAWNVRDSAVPRAAFPGGQDGYAITREVLKAANDSPEMLQAVKDAAVMSLRDIMKDGQLNPKALASWTNKYKQSLRAIDEVEPGFSGQFSNLANSQSALASKFVGAANADHATQIMGNVLGNKQTGPLQLRHLVKEAAGDPGVIEGLKKLAVDHMMKQAEASAGATGNFGPHFKKLIEGYSASLPELFQPDQLKIMSQLSDDISRQTQTRARMQSGIPGSDTAHRLKLMEQRMAPMPAQSMMPGISGGGLGLLGGLLMGSDAGLSTVAGAVGTHFASTLARNLKARGINNINQMYAAGIVDPQIGMRMLRHGAENVGDATWLARVNGAFENSPYFAQPGLETGKKKREGRASGGAVVNHARAAQHLTELVAKARRGDQAKTKELLGAHDNMIARALAVAGRAI